ncbi:unnamed protein product [Coregonus sp. 'balchen']|nr:unnamed protein product [Coregonus sp. 'balchen']
MYQNGTVMVQGNTPTAGAQAQTYTTGLSSPLPAYDHQSQDHTTISLLRDGLALLEDQINQCRTQLKNSVQELRESLTTALEEHEVSAEVQVFQSRGMREQKKRDLFTLQPPSQPASQSVSQAGEPETQCSVVQG